MLNKLDTIQYPYTLPDGRIINKQCADVLTSFVMRMDDATRNMLFQLHELKEHETPVYLSEKLYDTTKYYWTFYFINGVVNPFEDWLMDAERLEAYAIAKYGRENIYKAHHYINVNDGTIMDDVAIAFENGADPSNEESKPVSNLEHERNENEKKRRIRVINPRYIKEVIYNFDKMMKGQA